MVRLVSRESTFPEGVGRIFYLTNFRKGARGLKHYLKKWKILGGGGMEIFWNHTIQKILLFTLCLKQRLQCLYIW